MRDHENPEDGRCDICDARVGNVHLNHVAACETCTSNDRELRALRAMEDEIKKRRAAEAEITRLTRERDEARERLARAVGVEAVGRDNLARAERAEAEVARLREAIEIWRRTRAADVALHQRHRAALKDVREIAAKSSVGPCPSIVRIVNAALAPKEGIDE